MEVRCFGSGSRGNAFLVRTSRVALLIDAGFAPTVLRRELARCGIRDHELSAIIITHEHSDHVRGLAGLLRWHTCPVLATRGTFLALGLDASGRVPLSPGQWVEIGDLGVQPIAVPHDANEPIGLTIATQDAEVALFTDLGSVTSEVLDAVRTATLVVIEANHDRVLLREGPYPEWLKRRIASPYGHLSNDEAARLAGACGAPTRTLWLAHLSQENNRPALAEATVRERLASGRMPSVLSLPQWGVQVWHSDDTYQTQLSLPIR